MENQREDATATARRNWKRTTLRVRSMTRFRLLPSWRESSVTDDTDDANVTRKLGEYERLGVLGVGGAAVVYLVRHRTSHQLFAMKVQSCPMQQPWPRRTFHARKEQYILQMLHHPFVCRLHEAFYDNKRLYVVLDYHEGGSLADVQTFFGGTLTEIAVKVYATEIVHALEYVHTMGFVYRDLKPQNVLIAKDGHIRLTDFGVAHEGFPVDPSRYFTLDSTSEWTRYFDKKSSVDDGRATSATTASTCEDDSTLSEPDGDMPEETTTDSNHSEDWETESVGESSPRFLGVDDRVRLRSNSFVGTAEYMPPEMIQQVATQSSDVDWWALGCLLYELLYGTSPFSKVGEVSSKPLFRRILLGKLEFPMFPRVSDACKDLIRRLLSVDTQQRLGHRRGAAEVKAHAFFHGIPWAYHNGEPPVRVRSRCPSCLACQSGEHSTITPFLDDDETTDDDDNAWQHWNEHVPNQADCQDKCGLQYDRSPATLNRFQVFVRSQSDRFSVFRNRGKSLSLVRSDSLL